MVDRKNYEIKRMTVYLLENLVNDSHEKQNETFIIDGRCFQILCERTRLDYVGEEVVAVHPLYSTKSGGDRALKKTRWLRYLSSLVLFCTLTAAGAADLGLAKEKRVVPLSKRESSCCLKSPKC